MKPRGIASFYGKKELRKSCRTASFFDVVKFNTCGRLAEQVVKQKNCVFLVMDRYSMIQDI